MIKPCTQAGQFSGGIAVAVVEKTSGHGHGHGHVYDHDIQRLSRDYGAVCLANRAYFLASRAQRKPRIWLRVLGSRLAR